MVQALIYAKWAGDDEETMGKNTIAVIGKPSLRAVP